MKFNPVLILLISCLSLQCFAQKPVKNLEPSEYYDFWLGEWELTWQDPDGETQRGRNVITRILNGKVIKEDFEALTGAMAGYKGKSYSVYIPEISEWKQTWVDSDGDYLDFLGSIEGEKRIFSRSTKNSEGKTVLQRMVFYDIKKSSFMWNWEQSKNNGKSWDILWKITYRRH